MKIALIGRYGEGDILSGPERVARELHSHLLKNTSVIFIEYYFSGYSDYSFLKKLFGSKCISENVLRLGIFPLITKLLKEQYNILHLINSQRFTLIIFFLKPFLKGKFVSSFHGLLKNEVKDSRLKRTFLDLWLEKISLKKSDKFIFPSALLLKLFKKIYSFSEDNCYTIYNGVSDTFKNNASLEWIAKPGEEKIFNFVYYNSFSKGLNELLNEIPETEKFHARIFVIGKEQKLLSTRKNIEVYFVPPMNQTSLKEFLSDKHFVIKSPSIDSFSVFTAECMSAGLIPIVSEQTGIKELVEDNINGFIYNSDRKLKILLKEIYEGKYNLKEISATASKIPDKLSWVLISEQYLLLYHSLLKINFNQKHD